MSVSFTRALCFTFTVVFSNVLFSDPIQVLDRFIEQARIEWNIPGAAVSIVQGDQVIYSKGFGVLQVGHPEKVDDQTIFQLASVTKSFTAAGLGIQVEQGRLRWDDEVIKFLPQFALKDPYPTRFATPRDLLAHRTGLPAFGGDLLGKLGYSPQEILQRIRYIKPATSFRNKAYYSNAAYFVAGELLAALTQKTWEEVIQADLFVPLEMQRSGFAANLDSTNVAYGHLEVKGKTQMTPWDRTGGFPAAGAITSTATDMSHWMLMLLNQGHYKGRQILKPETIKALFQPAMVAEVSFSEAPPINENAGFSFSLGWDNYHYKGYAIVEKGGGLDGVRTIVTLIPELKLGITILSNLNLTLFPEVIRAKFLEEYLGKSDKDLIAQIQEKKTVLSNLLKPPAPPKNILPARSDLQVYTGLFENVLYGAFKVVEKDKQLTVEAGPAPFIGKLIHWSNDTFILQWPVVNTGYQLVTFTFGPEGQAVEMQAEDLGTFKIKDHKPS